MPTNPGAVQAKFSGGKMSTQGEATAVAALRTQFEKAKRAYPYFIPFSFNFDGAGNVLQVSQSMRVSAMGDFACAQLSGTIRKASDGSAPDVANILFKMRETGFNREYQQDWIPLETILTPGASTVLYRPIAWESIFLAKSTIEIDLYDKRATKTVALNIDIVLKGQQFVGSFGRL